jgi:hypothetical protein
MRYFHWSARPLWIISGFSLMALQMYGTTAGSAIVRCAAIVVNNLVACPRSPRPLEKKKLAPRLFCLYHLRATVRAIVDFPVPAIPFNQNMHAPLQSSLHAMICWRRSTRVSGKHSGSCCHSRELKAAPSAQGSWERSWCCFKSCRNS